MLTSCASSWQERADASRAAEYERLGNQAKERDANSNEYAYKLGTEHGCSSGYNAGGDITSQFKKDVKLYIKDEYYKNGWNDGFTKCKSIADSTGSSIDNALRTSPLVLPF